MDFGRVIHRKTTVLAVFTPFRAFLAGCVELSTERLSTKCGFGGWTTPVYPLFLWISGGKPRLYIFIILFFDSVRQAFFYFDSIEKEGWKKVIHNGKGVVDKLRRYIEIL